MALELPRPIAAYFDADGSDGEAVARCFKEDAVVIDEGRTHVGRAAIRRWKSEASKKYQYTSEPRGWNEERGKFVVTSRLSGSFPGSPVDLRFFFVLAGDEIASLEIKP